MGNFASDFKSNTFFNTMDNKFINTLSKWFKDKWHVAASWYWRTKENFGSWTLYVLIVSMVVVLILSLFWGIRSCHGSATYDFRTNTEAVGFYRDYLSSLRKIEKMDSQLFCSEVNRWRKTKDTIASFLSKDTTITESSMIVTSFRDINDSIRYEFLRLAETWKCSFNDLIRIKEGTTPFRDDTDIINSSQKASKFFSNLDTIKIASTRKDEAIYKYRIMLSEIEKNGIRTSGDLMKFLIMEDVCFRSFLTHLYELEGDNISDITETTERICRNIFIDARDGKLDKKEVITYMSMRTVRRLIQNSTVCVNDISHRKMRSEVQANAYLWMIIQPFMSIDQLAIAMITPEGRTQLEFIAEQLPKSTAFAKAFHIDQKSLSYLLPQQLLKMYILTL